MLEGGERSCRLRDDTTPQIIGGMTLEYKNRVKRTGKVTYPNAGSIARIVSAGCNCATNMIASPSNPNLSPSYHCSRKVSQDLVEVVYLFE